MLVILNNIPNSFRTCDLRNFFSRFIEEKRFPCFHYRHRPNNDSNSCWCPIELQNDSFELFFSCFHGINWITKDDDLLSSKVEIAYDIEKFVKIRGFDPESDLRLSLKELNPPATLPNGNVGTPTHFFFEQIRSCQLPPSLIKKLGLKFPKQKSNRRYGSVPYIYENRGEICSSSNQNKDDHEKEEGVAVLTGVGTQLKSYDEQTVKRINQRKRDKEAVKRAKLSRGDNENESSGSDGEEDWERGERLNENVFEQDRIKERLFEEEVELVWEKGSSGLVFYCDSALWDEAKGDFDERTTDDLDVDMSLYWKGQASNADQDAKDFVEMRKMQMMRAGHEFKIHPRVCNIEQTKKNPNFAKQLMMKQGWKPGSCLGSSQPGIVEPIEPDGQRNPKEKHGFGYRGEKLNRDAGKCGSYKRGQNEHRISSVYDPVQREDIMESLLEWAPATALKQRKV